MTCTRCGGTGVLNEHLLAALMPEDGTADDIARILQFLHSVEGGQHEVRVCDCCGDGDRWYGTPGEHYGPDDPRGPNWTLRQQWGLRRCH